MVARRLKPLLTVLVAAAVATLTLGIFSTQSDSTPITNRDLQEKDTVNDPPEVSDKQNVSLELSEVIGGFPILSLSRFGDGIRPCETQLEHATTLKMDTIGATYKWNNVREILTARLGEILRNYDHKQKEMGRRQGAVVPSYHDGHPKYVAPGRNKYGQIDDSAIKDWVDLHWGIFQNTLRGAIDITARTAESKPYSTAPQSPLPPPPVFASLIDLYNGANLTSFDPLTVLCGPVPKTPTSRLGEVDEALAKVLRHLGTKHLYSSYINPPVTAPRFGHPLGMVADCHFRPTDLPIMVTGYLPSHFANVPVTNLLLWRSYIDNAKPLDVAATLFGGQLKRSKSADRAFTQAFPLPPANFSTRITKFKQTSWLAMHNVCGFCESRVETNRGKNFIQGYLTKGLPCGLSLYSVGTEEDIHHLQGSKRSGRNGIYHQREASFQYSGHVQHLEDLSAIVKGASETTPIIHFVEGTAILMAPFAVANVGHVIQDALWGLTQTLLIGKYMNDHYYKNDSITNASHRMFEGVGGSISTLQRPLSKEYRAKRRRIFPELSEELLYIFPSPVRVLLGNGFKQVSSEFYASLATAAATTLLRDVYSSPFESGLATSKDIYCFETLVAGGSDRDLKHGHYSFASRESVASAIRQSTGKEHSSSKHPIRVFVYGRNDVHRRSVDNPATLLAATSRAVRAMRTKHGNVVAAKPILISTFNLSPQQQIDLSASIDILVTIQGAHMQNSLFMARDAVIIEIAPCGSSQVSFLKRYGLYMPTSQQHAFIEICPLDENDSTGLINFSQNDITEQNITLCPSWIERIEKEVVNQIERLVQSRKMFQG